ncbi:MAG: folylpolyglutamate synthase/dihydrofolate synthase family protein [Gemmatimonadota bacterium]
MSSRLFPPLPGVVQWGLERTERILSAMGDPHRSYPVLHVGGTNGKGSVARLWAGILRAAGYRTGLYTSPHLVSFRERILVDGRPLPDAWMEECSRDLRPLFLRESPSFFEAATCLAFLAFQRARVEVAVVEVGLGGRLDATNVVTPVVTAITNVARDHMNLLGEEIRQIAREKAGILKPGIPTFTASDDAEVLGVLSEEAAAGGGILRRVPAPDGQTTLDGSRLRVVTRRWGEIDLVSPLVGRHQLRNIALAVRALEGLPPRLPVSEAALREGVLRTRIPGRFQVERRDAQSWIFDAAHNPAGVSALVQTLDEVEVPRPRIALVGVLADKEWGAMLSQLALGVDALVLTVPESAPSPRLWDPALAAQGLPSGVASVVPDFGAAMEVVRRRAGSTGSVVVTGSAHTVGDALARLDWIPAEALPTPSESG